MAFSFISIYLFLALHCQIIYSYFHSLSRIVMTYYKMAIFYVYSEGNLPWAFDGNKMKNKLYL